MTVIHIGFDDTDSPSAGCTTYLCARLVEFLSHLNVTFIDYPLLIRLNPNVPFRTRGNAAICLRIKVDDSFQDKVKQVILEEIERGADLSFKNTNPGVVFYEGETIPPMLEKFSKKAIQSIVPINEALKVANTVEAEIHMFKNARGVIGALAAVGSLLENDHTYELIAYRTPESYGKPRKLDINSIIKMDSVTSPNTFCNIDGDRILITPHGPDPILYGVRGDTAEIVYAAHNMIISLEPIERWVIFRSNQGTDMHLRLLDSISQVRPYLSVILNGEVSSRPKTVSGGHVIVQIKDQTGSIDCAAYEPTGEFREVVRSLIPGDLVRVYGGVRPPSSLHPITINLEKIEILKLAPLLVKSNPKCTRCGKRMTSAGKNKGFKCKKCGLKLTEIRKSTLEIPRNIAEKLYLPPPRAHRHLTRPKERIDKLAKKSENMFMPWHYP
ncbi:MAG: tRNA(Ile)(2)-agmatinylcytidine synthase [Candidatus Jordarchaeaceae archaeon]